MKPLQVVYVLRVVFGIVAALLATAYVIGIGAVSKTWSSPNWSILFNGMSLAIILYIVSFYAIKRFFALKVEKPQKLFTMGIGIYFLTWIVFWILMYTIIASLA